MKLLKKTGLMPLFFTSFLNVSSGINVTVPEFTFIFETTKVEVTSEVAVNGNNTFTSESRTSKLQFELSSGHDQLVGPHQEEM